MFMDQNLCVQQPPQGSRDEFHPHMPSTLGDLWETWGGSFAPKKLVHLSACRMHSWGSPLPSVLPSAGCWEEARAGMGELHTEVL